MGILNGHRLLVAGVLNESSIAFRVAQLAQLEGAEVVLTGHGRRKKITEAVARRLPGIAPVLDFDAEDDTASDNLADALRDHGGTLDGVVHCISASYPDVIGEGFMTAGWDRVAHSMRVSAYSYQALVRGCLPSLRPGAGVVGCTLDASVAWPLYGWAGVAKAAYESTNRYLATWLGPQGIRANLVAAGPYRSATMLTIPGTQAAEAAWVARAPLYWDPADATTIAKTTLMLTTDWAAGTTGEVIHCDGGLHAIGD